MQRALQDPLSETESERHCVAEVKERGRRRRECQALPLKRTRAGVSKAPHSRDLGSQLPAGLTGALVLNFFAGPGWAALLGGGFKYLQPAMGPGSHARCLVPRSCARWMLWSCREAVIHVGW